jgi:hypothetical protein
MQLRIKFQQRKEKGKRLDGPGRWRAGQAGPDPRPAQSLAGRIGMPPSDSDPTVRYLSSPELHSVHTSAAGLARVSAGGAYRGRWGFRRGLVWRQNGSAGWSWLGNVHAGAAVFVRLSKISPVIGRLRQGHRRTCSLLHEIKRESEV